MLSIIAAIARNDCIGLDGHLPWPSIRADLAHFRRLTTGNTVIMGRRTFESLGCRPLPDRQNIVVSTTGIRFIECGRMQEVQSFGEALRLANHWRIFAIGGTQIYAAALAHGATRMYLTEIHADYEGDTFFPEWDRNEWREVSREPHDGYDFVEYERS